MSIKTRLLLGAAAPFLISLPALAQEVTISTDTTTPISTSTANSGAPADITITADGSVILPDGDGGVAVTVDSDNDVNNAGSIQINNSNNATGVLIQPGYTTDFTNSGTISIIEDYTRTDQDDDDDLDGPLAEGSGRAGILLTEGGTMTGSINLTGGSIVVEGNDSFGVSLRSVLDGDLRQRGAISLTGGDGVALDVRENVTGDVIVGGSITATGENSVGVNVAGDVGGEFAIDGSIVATGFTSTGVSNYADPDTLSETSTPIADRRDPDDLLEGGPGVQVSGNLGYGFLINGAAAGEADPTDDVKDVIQDFNENRGTGQINVFGSAPAVLIQAADGAAGSDINVGLVRESVRDTLDDDEDDDTDEVIATFNYDYGFINRGTISANGLNVKVDAEGNVIGGFDATGLRIAGSADGTHTTTIEGGVFNSGAITSRAYEADSAAVSIGSGAITPRLVNTGTISSTVYTETDDDSYGVLIESGANVSAVSNSGAIVSVTRGYDGDAIAFRDASGTVTTFTNSAYIGAGHQDDNEDDDITSGLGQVIALDFTANTTGVAVTQYDSSDSAQIYGDVLFGSGNDQFNINSGLMLGDISFGTGADAFQLSSASLTGDVDFGGATSSVNVDSGTWTGDLSLGASNATLSFLNGSTFNGDINQDAGGSGTLTVDGSTFNNTGAGTLQLSSMAVTNGSQIGIPVSNARVDANTPVFEVSGAASFGGGTVFKPIFGDFVIEPFTLRVINAGSLSLGGDANSLLSADSPFIYNMSLLEANGGNALDLELRVKSADELGLSTRQAGAYDGVLALLAEDATVGAAITTIGDQNTFLRSISDILPGSDVTMLRILSSDSTAAFGATARRLDLVTDKPDSPGGAWVEEFGVYHEADANEAGLKVSGGGFGVSSGIDLIASRNSVLGAFLSLESLEIEEHGRTRAPLNVTQKSVGAYGGWKSGDFALTGIASYGFVDVTSNRDTVIGALTDELRADWNANTLHAGARATYLMKAGVVDVQPYASVDYMRLNQDGYTETSTGSTGLGLIASDAESSLSSASAGATFTANFNAGSNFRFRPEASVGYRSILSVDAPGAAYTFTGAPGSTPFYLDPGQTIEDAVVGGLGLKVESDYVNLKIGYDAEVSDGAMTHYGSITLRIAFW
ncbi:MAG: autotransporter outer membrane beta-barrel domain-containing protein [Hyphomonadaceae bacterium]